MLKTDLLFLLGKRIQFLRKEKGLSQLEASVMCDIPQAYFSQIENGKRNITILTLKKIAIVLEVSLLDLIKGIQDW